LGKSSSNRASSGVTTDGVPTGQSGRAVDDIHPNTNHRIVRHIVSRPPVDTSMALGAARPLGLPIDDEGLEVIALPCPPLPAVGPERRTDHIDLMLGLGGDEQVCIDIAAVEQVRAREELPLGEVAVDRRAHDAVLRGRRCREHLGDQIGLTHIAGLGEMELIAHPMGIAFTAVAGFQVIGRGKAHRCRRLLVPGAPAQHFPPWDGAAVILLEPNPPQHLRAGSSCKPRAVSAASTHARS
jgi:hypothetical protein